MNQYEYQKSKVTQIQYFQTSRQIEAKFPPWDRGTKVCSNGLGHMTTLTAVPIYGKNLKNLLL